MTLKRLRTCIPHRPMLLDNLLKRLETHSSPEEQIRVGEELYNLFHRYLSHLVQAKMKGKNLIREVYRLYEEEAQNLRSPDITCRKGCGACCSFPIDVTREEAQVLAENVVEKKVPIDHDKLVRQSELSTDEYLRLANPENQCVFLGENGSCRVYDDRPLCCRNHLVTSPPQYCGSEYEKTVHFTIPESLLLTAAFYSYSGSTDLLPRQLQRLFAKPRKPKENLATP